MEILLSLITSGSINYIVILILSLGLGIAIFKIYTKSLDNERQRALQENNIRQLEFLVKEKDLQLQRLQEIGEKRDQYVQELVNEREKLETKLKQIEIDIEKKPASKASDLLKDVFKSLKGPTQ
jgi:hypothetical protein